MSLSVGLWWSVALDVRGWVVVVNGMVVRSARCMWVGFGLYGGVIHVVCCLWAVVVVHGGVAFICVGVVAVVCGRSWLSACEVMVVVVCGRSWWRVGILIIHRRPWVLVVNRGVVVGDGHAVVVVIPRLPGVWAFVA